MPLLLGAIEERQAWLRVLGDCDIMGLRDIINEIENANGLTLQLRRSIAGRPDVVKRLIDALGVWFPVEYYRSLPVVYPYIVRDPLCRQNRRNSRPEMYCSPNEQGFMRADNTPVKQLVEGREVQSPLRWFNGTMRRGFVASHAWRIPADFEQNQILASRDPWLNTFVPNLCWLPSALSKLTDEEGSFAQHYLQLVARSTYEHVVFRNEYLQAFVNRLWERFPPPELRDIQVPALEYRAQFRMRENDVADRIRDLEAVVSGVRDALEGDIHDRTIIHHRYTVRNLVRMARPERLRELHNDLSNYLALLNGDEREVDLRQQFQGIQRDTRRVPKDDGMATPNVNGNFPAIPLVFNPPDERQFRSLLLAGSVACRVQVLRDGRRRELPNWRAGNLTERSNLRQNIQSSRWYRTARAEGNTDHFEFTIQ